MQKVLALQQLQAVAAAPEEGNSDYSVTCDGNSCVSYQCTQAE